MCTTNFSLSLKALSLCFFCFANFACRPSPTTTSLPKPAFYHWKTQLSLSLAEHNYLNSLGVEKLYVKFFDVDWDEAAGQPAPLATVELDTTRLGYLQIIPTIFITNRCLLNLPMPAVDTLASRILLKVKSLAPSPPSELQFDCDWTPQTQAKYFGLLNSVKKLSLLDSPFTISATIRLHQLKYFEKTGVPPVDRGMLMCYNMGNLDDWATDNSLLDPVTLETYLQPQQDYPLPLDLALPLYRWGVLFRDGRLVKLLNGLTELDLQDTTRFERTAPQRFEVKKSTYLQAHYLYAGDQIRLEAATPEAVEEAANLLATLRSETPATVAFYHLDSTIIQAFPKEKIQKTLSVWVR